MNGRDFITVTAGTFSVHLPTGDLVPDWSISECDGGTFKFRRARAGGAGS